MNQVKKKLLLACVLFGLGMGTMLGQTGPCFAVWDNDSHRSSKDPTILYSDIDYGIRYHYPITMTAYHSFRFEFVFRMDNGQIVDIQNDPDDKWVKQFSVVSPPSDVTVGVDHDHQYAEFDMVLDFNLPTPAPADLRAYYKVFGISGQGNYTQLLGLSPNPYFMLRSGIVPRPSPCFTDYSSGTPGKRLAINTSETGWAYPNPAQDFILMEAAEEAVQVQIYNGQGQLVNKSQIPASTSAVRIDIRALSPGIYYLVRSENASVISTKFIKMP